MASSQVKTNMIFPNYHNAALGRTEFRIEPKVFLNTWRLSGIQAKPAGADASFPSNLGCASLIKNLHLMSGNTAIEEVRNVSEWMAFETLRNSNSVNLDMEPALTGTDFGFKVGPRNAVFIPTLVQTKITPEVKPSQTAAVATNGTISLQRVLKFLAADDIVAANIIPDLRLIIEWRVNDINGVFAFNATGDGVTGYTIQEPVLFLDEIVDPRVISKVNSQSSLTIPYFTMEQDRIRMPAVANTVTATNNIRFNAFTNKSVRRMLLVSNPEAVTNTGTDDLKGDASIAMHNEVYNFRVNGRNYFPFAGVDNANKKLDATSYVWGEQNICQGLQFDQLVGDANGDSFLTSLFFCLCFKYPACLRSLGTIRLLYISYFRIIKFHITHLNNTYHFFFGAL